MNQHNHSITDLAYCLRTLPHEIKGPLDKTISKLNTPNEADEHSLVWISPQNSNLESAIAQTQASIVICTPHTNAKNFPEKCFILTENPKLAFLRIGNALFKNSALNGIHPSAIIHPEAIIANNVYIGPYTLIGKCEIKEGAHIGAYCHLYDNVDIFENVTIHSGCKIGTEGLGHIFNEHGILENFPQIGKVVIKKNVELGVNTVVARGSLSSTQIGEHTKIDCNVVIGHNVSVGDNVVIATNTVLGGSSIIGDRTFIGINVTVVDYIHVGNDVFLGANTVIIKNVPDKTKVMPRPPISIPID